MKTIEKKRQLLKQFLAGDKEAIEKLRTLHGDMITGKTIFALEEEPGVFTIIFPGWGRDTIKTFNQDEYEAFLEKFQPNEVIEMKFDENFKTENT